MRRSKTRGVLLNGTAMGLAAFLGLFPLFPPALAFPVRIFDVERANSGLRRPDGTHQSGLKQAYGKLPLSFEINRGQYDSSVKFTSRGDGYRLFLTGREAILSLERSSDSRPDIRDAASKPLRMKLVGANPTAPMEGVDELAGKSNYFLGSDSGSWQTDVPTYAKVLQKNVYPGIDVIWYGRQQQLEYDFVVAPGANPGVIDIACEGIGHMKIDAGGDLVMATGGAEIRQHKPIVYQEENGIRKQLVSRYVLKGRHRTGIKIESYDRRRPLIIDPVLGYSTYFGSSGSSGWGIAVDQSGSAYVIGMTGTGNFPVTPGSYQTNKGDKAAIYVAKLNSAGNGVVYSAYIGGSGADFRPSIAVDSAGNAYIAGNTTSMDFPVTPGSFQTENRSLQSSPVQGFVAKLSATGSGLIYSTYLGGTGRRNSIGSTINAVALDASGNAYLTGNTDVSDFPTTAGSFQTVLAPLSPPNSSQPATLDAFVAKLNPTGSALVYSTFLGGGGSQGESAAAISVDSAGSAYVAGSTDSFDFPVTAGAFQTSKGTSWLLGRRGFVTKLTPDGSGLVYSTYLGGTSGGDEAVGLCVDSLGFAYVTGSAFSTDFPTSNGFQNKIAGGVMMKSVDGGGSLTASDDGLPPNSATGPVRAVAADPKHPDILYVGTEDGRIFKSTDGGEAWHRADAGLPEGAFIASIAIDPITTSTLYASLWGTSIYKSTDGGSSWSNLAAGGGTKLVIDPQNTSTIYRYAGGNISRSTDAGVTWVERSTGIPADAALTSFVIDPITPTTLYAAGRLGVFKSTNSAAAWTRTSNQRWVFSLAIDPRSPSTLYAGTPFEDVPNLALDGRRNPRRRADLTVLQGLIKTTDGGDNWSSQNDGLFDDSLMDVITIDPVETSTVYLGTRTGMLKSTNGARNWQLTPLLGTAIKAVIVNPTRPSTIYVGASISSDAFVAKLNPAGTALVYSTFIGGFSNERGYAIAVDSLGAAYVAGTTFSSDFPTKRGAFQPVISGLVDLFAVKIDASGASVYSTFLGGSSYDGVNSGGIIAVDSAGSVYLTGFTANTSDFPTQRPLQEPPGGSYPFSNTFIARIDGSVEAPAGPKITSVSVKGKKLLVSGENFREGAALIVDGKQETTVNDDASPETKLISKKAGKKVAPGVTSVLQVRNPDGMMSPEFRFVP